MPPASPLPAPSTRDDVTSGAPRRQAAVPARAVPRCGCGIPEPGRLSHPTGQHTAQGADLPGAFSSLGPGPGVAFGKMFSPVGCRRGFPREPGPWRGGPRPPRPHGPQDAWDEPPWEHQHERGRGRWWRRGHWGPRPFPGPPDFRGDWDDTRWEPHDRPPPPPWDDREDIQGPEDCFTEDWNPSGPWEPRPFPGPPDFHGDLDNRRWEPQDRPPWDDREDIPGPEDCFTEVWHVDPPLDGPGCFDWPQCPDEERHPPWTPNLPEEQQGFQDDCPPWGYRGPKGRRCRRRQLNLVQCYPRPPRGSRPYSRSSSVPWKSRPKVKAASQHPDPPQPPTPFKDDAQSKEQTAQGTPAVSGKVPEPPKPTSTPQESLAADPQVAAEAAEPERAAGATPVEPGAREKPTGSHDSALETEPAPPEESSAETGQHLEVEPCSPGVPEAGAGGSGSHPHAPTAPPEPAEGAHAAAGSAGEVGAELCPPSQGQQRLPSRAGEAEAEAARDELLGGLQPPENSQVPPGGTAEPDAQRSQGSSDVCTAPETSPGTQHPPGSGETEQAAGSQHCPCSALPTPTPAGTDLRSAAVLARKEEIELSYQQFSLTIAVVATMLLQKEPSMEAALGLALRANLRQGRIHHLQELEDFINSYDSATLSR
ncbi:uncharacterized protein O3Q21_011139 [Podargus strigoides]